MDTARLRSSWNTVAGFGGGVPLFFYSTLFLTHPHLREMFPAGMSAQRDKLVRALGRVVASVDDLESAVPFLQQLGRDHRKFSVTPDHYPAVGQALLTTLEHFLADDWTPELAEDWTAAYKLVADVMVAAAREGAHTAPPWWNAEVVRHERRGLDIAVLTLRTDRPLRYRPGQSVAVETALRPRIWRYFSPANAPREDNLLELHVRMVDGGAVSSALVQAVGPGDVLRLGSPVGSRLTLDHAQDVVLISGGTGLAPFKALLGQIADESFPRRAHLFTGARTARELYDLPALQALSAAQPRLRVTPVVSDDPRFPGPRGEAGEIALRHGPWHDQEVYVCGSPAMVTTTRGLLRDAGVDAERVRWEDFSGYQDPVETGIGFLTRG
ncbi:NAD(P)H-flavin reductase/hemoglobin-like flavoprotein [Amycolatopsis bartoniae]|uniref:nitric oxide dioxygenase n=1 Tax=Amycolatopsis bartoniae TaxID=941986 RepID=A0A8H9MAT5_9PSEU|nr:globin domain-containing protein [Amycolatopsis bartoniae]MBB2939554.1 NAD(P)H-flavin reductase/hemoglobin-like flavoprotein [Amycolatopsis bartoniae]TVT00025.1 oxidoreductase [Amycolatopsis bartoniae]GHF39158.1 flavohemoprotein [Amycolatopsis bartoniae]